jgi:hypothetical protein
MLNKTLVALTAVVMFGAVSTAQADYQFDSSGAPVDMHIVDAQNDAFASAGTASDVSPAWQVAPFSAEERALFDRTSQPYDGE